MEFLERHDPISLSFQLDISLVCFAHSRDIELKTRREFRYKPQFYNTYFSLGKMLGMGTGRWAVSQKVTGIFCEHISDFIRSFCVQT